MGCLTPSPPRPAERGSATSEPRRRKPPPRHHGRPGGKSDGAAPRALRDDEDLSLLGGAGQLRRSLLPLEKQGDGGANPRSWIWPEQTRDSSPRRRHLATTAQRQQLNLPLRAPAPPHRRSDQHRRRERRRFGPAHSSSLCATVARGEGRRGKCGGPRSMKYESRELAREAHIMYVGDCTTWHFSQSEPGRK
jgi:hypothetical protein